MFFTVFYRKYSDRKYVVKIKAGVKTAKKLR